MIFGTHRPTVTVARMNARSKVKFFEKPDGDGTIPRVSASGNGLTGNIARFAIPFAIHAKLFEYETAQRVMKNVLLDRPMNHFAFAFEKPMYHAGETLGVAVDLRDANGIPMSDAEITVHLRGGTTKLRATLEETGGDFYALLQMPVTPVHLQYTVIVRTSRLATPIEQTGMLWASN
jgi:hypothetical protein